MGVFQSGPLFSQVHSDRFVACIGTFPGGQKVGSSVPGPQQYMCEKSIPEQVTEPTFLHQSVSARV